jgi:hypothetical protein
LLGASGLIDQVTTLPPITISDQKKQLVKSLQPGGGVILTPEEGRIVIDHPVDMMVKFH